MRFQILTLWGFLEFESAWDARYLSFSNLSELLQNTTNRDLLPVVDNESSLMASYRQNDKVCFNCKGTEMSVTWWKLHLPEAFDWRRDPISINEDVVLLPDTLISGFRHVQDVTWGLPAIKNIQVIDAVHTHTLLLTTFVDHELTWF